MSKLNTNRASLDSLDNLKVNNSKAKQVAAFNRKVSFNIGS